MDDFLAYIMAYGQEEYKVAIHAEKSGFINWC